MKYSKISIGIALVAACMTFTSCDDNESYADMLNDEIKSVNKFLLNQKVILELPEDGNFIEGENAPYYRLDEDGNVYMQVVNSGNKKDMAKDEEQIYFRFTRWSLHTYNPYTGDITEGWGNSDDLSVGASSFRYNNTSLSSSLEWGSGLQMPLKYVGMESEVNLVIKSQYGVASEISQVIPFLYNVRYFRSGTSSEQEDNTSVE